MTERDDTVHKEPNTPPASGERRRSSGADATAQGREIPPQLIEWSATLSILQNKVVVRQLGLVFAIPLAVLALVLALILRPSSLEEWGFLARIVLIASAFYLGLLLVAILVYGGRYEYEFRLNDKGVAGRPYGRTARKNRAVNLLLLLSGSPSAAGSGMLAQARQVEYVAWKDVDTVVTDPRHTTITLQKGKRPLMVVPCGEQHYHAVLEVALEATARTRSRTARKNKKA